jgi:hypothetical protein
LAIRPPVLGDGNRSPRRPRARPRPLGLTPGCESTKRSPRINRNCRQKLSASPNGLDLSHGLAEAGKPFPNVGQAFLPANTGRHSCLPHPGKPLLSRALLRAGLLREPALPALLGRGVNLAGPSGYWVGHSSGSFAVELLSDREPGLVSGSRGYTGICAFGFACPEGHAVGACWSIDNRQSKTASPKSKRGEG